MNKSAFLRVRVTQDLKEAFEAICQDSDQTPSDVLHEFVKQKARFNTDKVSVPVEREVRWKVVNTRLTSREYQSMSLAVKADNTTNSKWLLRCIREKSLQAPQLKDHDIDALSTALYRLQSVGRTFNQYVKCLHSDQVAVVGVEGFNAVALTASISETTHMVRAIIKAATVRDFEHV